VIFPSEYSRRHHARLLGLDGPVIPNPIPLDRIVVNNPDLQYVALVTIPSCPGVSRDQGFRGVRAGFSVLGGEQEDIREVTRVSEGQAIQARCPGAFREHHGQSLAQAVLSLLQVSPACLFSQAYRVQPGFPALAESSVESFQGARE